MTITKKVSLSVAALSLLSTAAFASGSLTVTGKTIASELLMDNNATIGVDVNTTYKPALNAGVNDGKFVINLTNATVTDVSDLYVYNKSQSKTVTKSGTQAVGDDGAKIILDINDSINSGDELVLANSAGNLPDLLLTVLANSSSATINEGIVNNNDTTLDTSASVAILTAKQEWTAEVKTRFSKQIDASASFDAFTDGSDSDSATLQIIRNDVDYGATLTTTNLYVQPDNNVSAFAASFLFSDGTTSQSSSNEYNTTISGLSYTKNVNVEFINDSNASTQILETSFTATVKTVGIVSNSAYKATLLNNVDFGAWTIYGYKGQIPNVVSIDGKFDTTLKFTNRSSSDANIYFTLIDQDGTTATLSSVDNAELATLPKNATGVYSASELLSLVDDADFDKTQSFSVEVSIPTAPSGVYGFASFKNLTLGQFKDLPIYNTSSMAY